MKSNNNNLPKGWRKVKLGEIVEKVIDNRGKNPPLSNIKTEYKLIDTLQLTDDTRYPNFDDETKQRYVSEDVYNTWFRTGHPLAGDILMSTVGSGIPKWNLFPSEGNFCIAQNLIGLRTNKNKANSEFIFYYFRQETFLKMVKGIIIGGAQPSIKVPHFLDLEIAIPDDINEQKRIADILSAFDEKIEVNNKIIKILEEMAQEIFKEWFVRFRFPGWQKVKFVDSELGKIPEGWEVKKLGDILSLEYGKALTAPNRKAGNIPVYASSGIVGYHNEKLDNGPGIIVGRAGIPGSVYWSQTDFYCVDSAFYVKTTISKYFVYYLLKYQNLESLVSGSAVPGLNRNMVYLNLAVLPNIEIINKFEDFIKPVFLKIYNLKAENQTLAELRDLLLPKLMSGEIRV